MKKLLEYTSFRCDKIELIIDSSLSRSSPTDPALIDCGKECRILFKFSLKKVVSTIKPLHVALGTRKYLSVLTSVACQAVIRLRPLIE